MERKFEATVHCSILIFFSTYYKLKQNWKCIFLTVMKLSSLIIDINSDHWGKVEQNPRTRTLERNEETDKIVSLSLQTVSMGVGITYSCLGE